MYKNLGEPLNSMIKNLKNLDESSLDEISRTIKNIKKDREKEGLTPLYEVVADGVTEGYFQICDYDKAVELLSDRIDKFLKARCKWKKEILTSSPETYTCDFDNYRIGITYVERVNVYNYLQHRIER